MNTIKYFFLVLVALPLGLAACSGAEVPTDAKAPTLIPPSLQRTSYETGAAAEALIEALQIGVPSSADSWIATYGSGPNEILISASGLPTEEAAAAAVSKMQAALSRGHSVYANVEARTVEYQLGFQMRDETNRFAFVYAQGRWVLTIRSIVQNLPSGVTAVEWVPSTAS